MQEFQSILLATKRVSVWGVGYLGYTIALRLQENGFYPVIHDYDPARLEELAADIYPTEEQNASWSKNGKIPSLNLDKAILCNAPETLFENPIHIISFPSTDTHDYDKLADFFIQNRSALSNALVIFQSAGVPGSIDTDFARRLKEEGIKIDIASVFRSDWVIEDFLANARRRVISGNSDAAITKADALLELLKLNTSSLQNIEEAEVYENTKNALSFTVSAFFNQLALSYPDINIGEMMKRLLSDLDLGALCIGVSSIDYKSEQAVSNLLKGGEGEHLSILQEAASVNISFLFYYIEILKQKGVSSVTLLGLSSYNSLKDIRFSPSIILAESLNKAGINVSVHDQNFSADEIGAILPFGRYIDITKERLNSDAVIIMSLSEEYKFLTQEEIEGMGMCDARFVLDNTGFFKNHTFKDAVYHAFGDGNLPKVAQ